jgi:hypothetical protein
MSQQPAPYRILVTGSRDWPDHDVIYDALDAILFARPDGRDSHLVVGDCPRGADRIAYQWAVTAMVPTEIHRADWTALGRAAGPMRNKTMVDAGADICLAFIRNGSRGATGCAALAEAAGIPVRRWAE